jgi:TolA-binding protein
VEVRVVIAFLLVALSANASVYYAKVEPLEAYTIKASAGGTVVSTASDLEGTFVKDAVVVQLDDALNKTEIKRAREKLTALQNMEKATGENLVNLEKIASLKQEQYNRIKDLKTKSQTAKEAEYIALVNAQNQVVSARSSLHNLESQIADLTFKIESLQDTVAKKRIELGSMLLYALHVKEYDVVNVGATLAQVHDVSQGKLTLFLSAEDAKQAREKTLYLDDTPTEIGIHRLWPVADEEHISSYKAEIIIPAPKTFSALVKVEFK